MSKNVAVFVDVANIFYAAKAAGVDIDYVTLLRSASAGRDLVRAYAYTGLDPDNENQRNFHSFLARNGYRVVSKDIRKYGDGKVKANLDIELVVDMLKTARNLDIAIVVSGDGDFAPAIRAVQEMGVRVEVISFRGNTSSDLIDVADQFTDIVHLAKVEKASTRSGRRVAEGDEDLSMTEVPDKQTEGTGGRGRGRGRERTRTREAEPVARASRAAPRGRTAEPVPAALTSSGAPLVVLPGEKLSRVAAGEVPAAIASVGHSVGDDDSASDGAVGALTGGVAVTAGGDGDEGAEHRRRRRRGGRGRGRGRGRGEAGDVVEPRPVAQAAPPDVEPEEFVEAPRRGPRPTPFGSVWDSQLGVPTKAPALTPLTPLAPLGDDDDFEEPEIPEYLIAERNRGRTGGAGGGPGRGGPRGNRAGYAAAVDRERYGRGGGGGINRYPDTSGRDRPRDTSYPRQERPDRSPRPAGPRGGGGGAGRTGGGGGGEWSEVPPELEAMLRAQLSARPKGESVSGAPARRAPEAAVTAPSEDGPAEAAAPKARAPRRASAGAKAAAGASADAGFQTAPPKRTPARRTGTAASGDAAGAAKSTPKPRATARKPAAKATSAGSAAGDGPKPRATRRKASTEPPPA